MKIEYDDDDDDGFPIFVIGGIIGSRIGGNHVSFFLNLLFTL